MKKLLACFLVMLLTFTCLTACGYKQNEWFSEEKLSKCLIPDFPEIDDNYVLKGNNDLYVYFSEAEYKAYVNGVYEYLKTKNFEYLGTRGEIASSLSGAFTSYYFEPAESLEDFYVDGAYRFVYSDGVVEDGDDELRFCILIISDIASSTNTVEDDGKTFKYNTTVKLRYNSEYPLSGRYVLPKQESEHKHTYDYICNEHTHQKIFTCGCPSPDIAEEHINYDEDMLCDLCGYTFEFYLDSIEWLYSDTHHWWVPEGENTFAVVYGYGEHVNNDADLNCDVCGYLMEQPTPTNYFLRNRAGCEWLNEITADDIAEVKIISAAIGVAPGAFKDISKSVDKAVIARIFEDFYWLDTSPISRGEGEIDGGGAVTVTFTLKDGSKKELFFNNGNYRDTNGDYFDLLYTPKFKEGENFTSRCGFISYRKNGVLYTADSINTEPFVVCEIPIDELEFLAVVDDIYLAGNPVRYIFEMGFGNLYFVSEEYFYMKGDSSVYYQLLGKTLDEFIPYPILPDYYSVTVNNEEWLYEDLRPAYKAGETVSVKIGTATDLGFLLFVNGERIMPEHNNNYEYWEFVFTMPDEDVVIDFKTYDRFLPDANYAVLIEAYWEKIPEADSVSIIRYYGEYDSGAIAAMMACSEYDFTEAEWDEHIEDVVIHYSNGNRIIVLYEGEFYNLTQAYENGYLSIEEITAIAEIHNG